MSKNQGIVASAAFALPPRQLLESEFDSVTVGQFWDLQEVKSSSIAGGAANGAAISGLRGAAGGAFIGAITLDTR